MTATKTETKSYLDPLGERAAAAEKAAREYTAKFPPVASVYDSFYASFAPLGKEGLAYLAGAEGVIGTKVAFREQDGQQVCLLNHNGQTVAELEGASSARLSAHLAKGWQVTLILSLVLYNQNERSHTGEIACFCYAPEVSESLDAFTRNSAYRVSKGEHPGLALSQEQFIRVLESKGAWYLTKAERNPQREPGVIAYKRRRSLGEGLVERAYQGGYGCKIATIIFWLFIALVLALIGVSLFAEG